LEEQNNNNLNANEIEGIVNQQGTDNADVDNHVASGDDGIAQGHGDNQVASEGDGIAQPHGDNLVDSKGDGSSQLEGETKMDIDCEGMLLHPNPLSPVVSLQ